MYLQAATIFGQTGLAVYSGVYLGIGSDLEALLGSGATINSVD